MDDSQTRPTGTELPRPFYCELRWDGHPAVAQTHYRHAAAEGDEEVERDVAWCSSPMMIREGGIRSASLTNRRRGTSPTPPRLGWRHCMLAKSQSGIVSSMTSWQNDALPGAGRGNETAEERGRAGPDAAGDRDRETGFEQPRGRWRAPRRPIHAGLSLGSKRGSPPLPCPTFPVSPGRFRRSATRRRLRGAPWCAKILRRCGCGGCGCGGGGRMLAGFVAVDPECSVVPVSL